MLGPMPDRTTKTIERRLSKVFDELVNIMKAHNKTGALDSVKAGKLFEFNEETLFMLSPYTSRDLKGDDKTNLIILLAKQNWLDATALLIRGDNEILVIAKACAEAASKTSKLVERAVEKERTLFYECQASIERANR